MSTDPTIEDPEQFVLAYRTVVEMLDNATDDPTRQECRQIIERMRKRWADWNGGDVHELDEVARGDHTSD